ncbi:MAG: hypothetical protein IKK23_09100 [Bacteroidales bacterium]|nr:hypothetical protein [Bacteroidales bacterium]
MGTIDNSTEFDFNVYEKQIDNTQQTKSKSTRTQTSSQPSVSAQPQIPGDMAPFIVLCGPPESGKSMVLKSLASYLYKSGLGYTIAANTTLLNTAKYQEDCAYFDSIIGDPDTRMPNTVDYLMADIIDKGGNVVAHFLEAPGEDFFSLDNASQEPNIQFKGYLEKVAQTSSDDKPRKVIYVMLLDLDSTTSFRNNPSLRDKYEKKMIKLYNRFVLHHPSRVILLYNKVDIPRQGLWANSNGCSNPNAVIADAQLNYPQLFFKKKFLFWDIENYSFLPFCTGSYPDDGSYTASGPAYPAALWKEITKQLW